MSVCLKKINLALVNLLFLPMLNKNSVYIGKESAVAKRSETEKKILNEVLPSVATQMRGPLSVLHASLEKLLRQDAPGVAQLNQSYHQLLRLAGNLSAVEILNKETWKLDMANCDLVVFCRKFSERLKSLAEDRGIAFRFETPMDFCVIACDKALLERLLLNLVSNALKFTGPGGTVTLSLHAAEQDILLSVSDTGRGIPAEKMEQLFDRYLHGESMDPTPHGLGIGLPLCRAIAEAHGGRIFAESQVGVGTKVTVALPDKQSVMQTMRAPRFDYAGGFDHVMVELSDALSTKSYEKKR